MAMLNADNGTSAAIRYDVVKNYAQSKAKGTNIFNARVQAPTKSLREVADTMVREGCKYDSAEVVAILEKFASVTTRLLQEGNAINVGSLVRFRPSIRGKFNTPETAFSKADHRIVVNASIGSALRDVAATAQVMRVSNIGLPEIATVYNGLTGTHNTVGSQGPLVIMGKRFIWDEEAEDEGFFTEVDGLREKCELTSLNEEGTTAFINIPQEMMEGIEARLYFFTRNTASGELAMIRYDAVLTYEA